jgi:hypothetical protein
MIVKALGSAAAAAVLALIVVPAKAAPMQSSAAGASAQESGIIQVHGVHRSCKLGPAGWHRHTKWGERRVCRPWRGNGRRPDACIKIGPIWYCDY